MSKRPVVSVWQDPRDRVCIAVGDGQPISLTRDEAGELHKVILGTCEAANADIEADAPPRAVTLWQGPGFAVGIDTSKRFVNKTTKAMGRRLALVTITIRGVNADLSTTDAAATAHKIGRYAVRPYVRKTVEVDFTNGHDGV